MDEHDKFQFYSKSADKQPGKGAGESLVTSTDYSELSKIAEWRRKLSNFSDSCPLEYDGLQFRTIEHAFHYAKISQVDQGKAYNFCLNSKSHLSNGSGEDARKARKMVILNDIQLQFWAKQRPGFLRSIWRHKARTCEEFKLILRCTKKAQLYHYLGRSGKSERWIDLENIRNELSGD